MRRAGAADLFLIMRGSGQGPADVAAANQLLNNCLGGRRPSWMATGDCSAPDPPDSRLAARKKRPYKAKPKHTAVPLASATMLSVLLPAGQPHSQPHHLPAASALSNPNVLPSPTLSDEPSPASATNPPDSPIFPRQVPVLSIDTRVQAQTMDVSASCHLDTQTRPQVCASAAVAAAATSLATIDANRSQFPPTNNLRHISRAVPTTGSPSPPTHINAQFHQAGPAGEVAALSRPGIGGSSYVQNSPLGPSTPTPSPQLVPWPIQAQSGTHNAKRQRVESRFVTWAKAIQAYKEHMLRNGTKLQKWDMHRAELLREACEQNDGFFLQIHQAYCRMSYDPATVYSSVPLADKGAVDRAFNILKRIIMDNQHVSPEVLGFFARFPQDCLWKHQPALGEFVARFSANWDAMLNVILHRKRLILANELIHVLGCHSSVLQRIIFTWLRRYLHVTDNGPNVSEVEALFARDQKAAALAFKEQSALALNMHNRGPNDWHMFEAENEALVRRYVFLLQDSALRAAQRISGNQALPSQSYQAAPTTAFSHLLSPAATPQWQPGPLSASQSPALRVWQQTVLPSSPAQITRTAINSNGQAQQPPSVGAEPLASRPNAHMSQPVQNFANGATQNAWLRPDLVHLYQVNPVAYRQNQLSSFHLQSQPLEQSRVLHPLASSAVRSGPDPPRGNGLRLGGTPVQGSNQQQARVHTATRPDSGPLLPHRGTVMPRARIHNPSDLETLRVGSHQVMLRSPLRRVRTIDRPQASEPEMYFQFVQGLKVPPTEIGPSRTAFEFSFNVEDASLLSVTRRQPGNGLEMPVAEHFEGSLRLRLRCCRIRASAGTPNEAEWITTASSWPRHIFMSLISNGGKTRTSVTPRRAAQNSKDLPAELTDAVSEGINTLVVSVDHRQNDPNFRHFLAVEVLETRSFSSILADIHANQVLDPKATVDDIQRKAGWASVDRSDDVQVVANTEYTVDMTCPFMAAMWETPVRGADCMHVQCFDLKTWLKTRDRNPRRLKCQTHTHPCDCFNSEPSVVDHWKCPVCNGDARPQSLRIDGFLADVRRELEADGNLQNTKTLVVYPDNSWHAIKDDDDDDDDEDGFGVSSDAQKATDGTGAARNGSAVKTGSSIPSVSHGSRRPQFEVIELLSDED